VTVLFAVPTLFQTLQRIKLLTPEALPAARVFVFGGEGYPISDLAAFHDRFRGQARLINVYGPTETSCICSSHLIDDETLTAAGEGFAPLGRMHADFTYAILDEDARDVAPGNAGELWIGGPNVGLGYYARPEETAQRFCRDPRQNAYSSVWYRSGDLVREDEAGLLWFCGRADNQVKIRGYRIELEEIDLAIESIDGVTRAIAIVLAGHDGPELHVAFTADGVIEEAALRKRCHERLPTYMQPVVIRQLDEFPKNANGKVDRKAIAQCLSVTACR
jgi:D-alanine--poly(phosphoribitol) ligase subunit 1